MNIIELDSKEYDELINPYHKFNSAKFNSLNSFRVEDVKYLIFKDSKVRLGIIGGISNNTFKSPFSAPFGGFSYKKEPVKLEQIEKALDLLQEWALNNSIDKIQLTLPPQIYNSSFISKLINTLYRKDFSINTLDLNYYFKSKNIIDEEFYISKILWHNARKSLKRAFSNNLEFIVANSLDEKKEAYNIIKQNRAEKNYPLRMSFNDITLTDEVIEKEFFIVKKDNISVASAIVYFVAKDIVQVVYWGDLQEYANFRVMNFLSFNLFKYYRDKGIKYIDIGPSTENSIPNYGLCDFKESIGCSIEPKYIFTKVLK